MFLLLSVHNLKILCSTTEDNGISDSGYEVMEEETEGNENEAFKPTHEWQKVGKGNSVF